MSPQTEKERWCGKRTKVETRDEAIGSERGRGRQARRRTGTWWEIKDKKEKRRGCFLLVGNKQKGHRKLGYDKSRTQERPRGQPKNFAFARKQKKRGQQQ